MCLLGVLSFSEEKKKYLVTDNLDYMAEMNSEGHCLLQLFILKVI